MLLVPLYYFIMAKHGKFLATPQDHRHFPNILRISEKYEIVWRPTSSTVFNWRHVTIGTTFLTFFESMENGHCAMVLALADDNYILIFEKKYIAPGYRLRRRKVFNCSPLQ